MKVAHEKLRTKFVSFDGMKELFVNTDTYGFEKGKQNDWTKVFSNFSKQIKEYIGEGNYSNLIPKFTTTTPLSTAIHELGLMNAM